ncbi:MAG: hypothetical protein WKF74_02265 [Pyrinomonadaceae bacterium]
MIGKKNERSLNERLDRIGRAFVRASGLNDEEAESAASSPFLYARLRSRIAAERARREAGESWFALVGVAWRTIPAMALTTVLAVTLLWLTSTGAGSSTVFGDESLLGASDNGIEQVVFADGRVLSSDDVLATIMNDDGREASR